MKAKNYRSIRGQLYTRKEYARGSPQPRIVKYTMGTENEEYDTELLLKARERLLIRDNALEAVRVSANRNLEKLLGTNYLLRIITYPHHLLRENKMMTGAGADRLQEGMKRSFGKIRGRAAAVNEGQAILSVKTFKGSAQVAAEALRIAASKIPKGADVVIAPIEGKREGS
jgi:large subunit ribosomal protein L10e